MLFNSLDFLIFFPSVVFIYFFLKEKYRNPFLLIASYYFYMSWFLPFGFLLLGTTVSDYMIARKISNTESKRSKKTWLLLSIGLHLAILFYFKYHNFFLKSFSIDLPLHDFLLPAGISFYTFQAISYVVDVYRGDTKVEKDFVIFALFISFFPQLVAGPIERSRSIIPQLRIHKKWSWKFLENGLPYIILGFFKKLVIADRLSAYVKHVHDAPTEADGTMLALTTIFFSIQVYCDFSGYSDIARGCAKVFDISLVKNFDHPYLACRFSLIVKKWHLSLNDWFRNYVFNPLGGWRKGRYIGIVNFMLVMLISGFWHGANLTFVIWSFLVGLLFLIDHFTPEFHLPRWIKFLGTQFIWLLTTIFFRANSIQSATDFYKGFFSEWKFSMSVLVPFSFDNHFLAIAIANFLLIALFWYVEFKSSLGILSSRLTFTLILIILLFGNFHEKAFIYYQF